MPPDITRRRRRLRLDGYDYSQPGGYYVTLCTKDRLPLFGRIRDARVMESQYGSIVRQTWLALPDHYANVALDWFVVMPDHVHGIILLADGVGTGLKPAPTRPVRGLPEIVRALKTFSARRINELRRTPGRPVWQRNYYERVVRGEHALDALRQYVRDNPLAGYLKIRSIG